MADNARYLLGLDAGNTVIKAVLFDTTGRQVSMAARNGRSSTPEPGYVERDLDELWRNACEAIGDCLTAASIDPATIAAIGCAGHGNGLYLLDEQADPILGIQSLDTRAADLANAMAAEHGDALHALCLQKPWPSQTPVLLAWVKKHQPDLYQRAATVLLCKDFINQRLTGRLTSDVSDMSGCGLVRLPEARYDDDLLALYGLADARDKLPDLIAPDDIAGRVTDDAAAATGLAAGTPVIGGYFDVISSAMGAGVIEPGQASIIAGTWSINQTFSEEPVVDPGVFMVANYGPGRFVNIEASATSAANLEWYVREFVEHRVGGSDPFAYCNDRIAEVSPSADDPFFHPYLYGSGQDARARAGFYGLTGWHTEGHMLRALFEGVVFEHRRHIEKLTSSGVSFDSAVMSGGGTRSPHWPQIMADCLGVSITVADCDETGALGAATGAGVGVGVFADYESAVATMTRPRMVCAPDPGLKAHYDDRYRKYLEIADALSGFWAGLAR